MPAAASRREGRILGLDGLRGVAVLIVLLSHTSIRDMYLGPGLDFSGIGKSGVYLFFILSAMLLSIQLLEWGSSDYQSAGRWFHYFQRRVFRIWPLFILVLLVSLVTTIYAASLPWGRGVPAYLTPKMFLSALFLISEKSLLWTVAVEFKFYFILPLIIFLLYFLFRNKLVPSLMFLFPLLWLAYGSFPPAAEGSTPWPFLTVFLSGIVCAVVYHALHGSQGRYAYAMEALGWLMVVAFILSIPTVFSKVTGVPVGATFLQTKHLLFSAIWSLLILGMLFGSGWLRKVFDSRPLVFLGKISYSLYVWQLVVLIPVYRSLPASPYIKGWISVTTAILLATASFYLLERPVLRWSARLAIRQHVGKETDVSAVAVGETRSVRGD